MQIRRDLGLPEDAFIIGINGANKDTIRKSYPAQCGRSRSSAAGIRKRTRCC